MRCQRMEQPKNRAYCPATWTLRTEDPDEFAEKLRPAAGQLSVQAEHRKRFIGELDAARLVHMSMFTVQFAATRVANPKPRNFLSVTAPISGTARIRTGQGFQDFTPGSALVLPHATPLDYHVDRNGCRSLVINFDQSFIDSYLQTRDLPFPAGAGSPVPIDQGSARGRAFLRLAHFAWGEVSRGRCLDPEALAPREMENNLLAAYLDAVSPEPPREQCLPAHIRRATDYLMGHLCDTVSLAEVAKAARLSERSLRRGFQKRFGVTVLGFLQQRRLELAHSALQSAEPGETTVTEIALQFGFSHLGRFSKIYRQTFGCLPSESLNS